MQQLIFGTPTANAIQDADRKFNDDQDILDTLGELEYEATRLFLPVELSDWLFDHSDCEPEDVLKLIRQLASNYTTEYMGDDDKIGKIGDGIMELTRGY